MSIVIGLQAAAARAGLPRTSLRRLVSQKKLAATKLPDGSWTFDERDLDALREARSATTAVVAPTASAVAPVGAPAAAPVVAVAPGALDWAVAAADAARVERVDDQGDNEHGPAEPVRHVGSPLGLTRSLGPVWPYTATAAVDATQVAQLQAQLGHAQQQLAHALADCERHRSAWRAERCRRLAADEALTAALAATGGVGADVAHAVGGAVTQALSAITDDDQLADDRVACSAARAAGAHAAHAARAWAEHARRERGYGDDYRDDELARARRRRAIRARY